MSNTLIHVLKSALKEKNIVFLTGAGVSTHSGIPDYRGVNGVYNTTAQKMLSRKYFNEHPFEVSDFICKKLKIGSDEIKPNKIHEWIASFKNATVITQNIDGLHEAAGSNTIAYHGTAKDWKCLSCKKNHAAIEATSADYICSCGGILEPQVAFYDDNINRETDNRACEAIANADVVIVIGTSLSVYPFADLIFEKRKDALSILINKTKTMQRMHYYILDDALNVVNEIMEKPKENSMSNRNLTLKTVKINKYADNMSLRDGLCKITDKDYNGNNGEEYFVEVDIYGEKVKVSKLSALLIEIAKDNPLKNIIELVIDNNYSESYYKCYKYSIEEVEDTYVVNVAFIEN